MRVGVQCCGSGVWSFGCRVWGVGCRVSGIGCRVKGGEVGVQSSGFRVSGVEFWE